MDELIITPLKQICNIKGDIFHAMSISSVGFSGFGEAYFSTIRHREIKGWKRHLKATLNFVVIKGSIRFFILKDLYSFKFDNRENIFEILLGPSVNYSRLTIPPGFWVAFTGVSEDLSILLNISNFEHDPNEAENKPVNTSELIWTTK
jgi:dTDP-4-dehydrorhamnose 3,5-epimerase